MRLARALSIVVVAGAVLTAADRSAGAETITLKDGQEISGTVVRRDGDTVTIQLPRSEVAAVNGQPLSEPVATGAKAPDFTGVDLSGTTHVLSDKKPRVTLLKFWASWCPYCRADIPLMKAAMEKYRGQGLRLLTVSVDQDLNKLKTLVANEQLPYPVIPAYELSAPPEQAKIPALYETQGIPAYFVIDRTGTIVKTFSGSLASSKTDLDEVLKPLLEKKPTR